MFYKDIEFIAHESYIDNHLDKDTWPKPASHFVPDWYKEVKHSLDEHTVKGCMPFLDSLTAGYIITFPQDMRVEKKITERGEEFFWSFAYSKTSLNPLAVNVNTRLMESMHTPNQLGSKCPYHKVNNETNGYLKVMNPWTIKTPPGYSCLFLPPLNNPDFRFQVISGIVDTDLFDQPVNLPIITNTLHKDIEDCLIKKGTPLAQVIPFKRENWSSSYKKDKGRDLLYKFNLWKSTFIWTYKNKIWKKKTWK
tara:strand:- start:5089 stop:5841 length:753 start_codon:yes stop_codon:yes gene_type:complete